MRKVGLIGGISWVSTIDYYKFINEGVNTKLGGLDFAEVLIYSLNFGDIQAKGWENSYDLLLNACKSLKNAGVDGLALCANTAHLFSEKLQKEVKIPIIHIVEETAKIIGKNNIKRVGLLGTKFTMEMNFYRDKLMERNIEVLIPEKQETRDYIQLTLKEELGIGLINVETKKTYLRIIDELIKNGAQGLILGCTEIPLLINQEDIEIPVFDSTKIHSEAIVNFMLS